MILKLLVSDGLTQQLVPPLGGWEDRRSNAIAISWLPASRVSAVVRCEENSSELRARNDRTVANMSDEGFERGAATGAATAATA